MALVLLCGQPCSGKSTAARELRDALQAALAATGGQLSVLLIDELSLHHGNHTYKDMVGEKNLRGELRSAVDRAVTKGRIVIVDSGNSIKGYRYELWCLARAAATKYCTVYCDVDAETARAWNEARASRGEATYTPRILEDLLGRFERPDSRNRWDCPLFELHPTRDSGAERRATLDGAVEFLTAPPQATRGRGAQNLQPTLATQNMHTSDASVLYELDRATQEVLAALMEAQGQAADGAAGSLEIWKGTPPIIISFFGRSALRLGGYVKAHRSISLPELRRHRRTFLKLAGQAALSGPPLQSDSLSGKRSFVDYLNREIASEH